MPRTVRTLQKTFTKQEIEQALRKQYELPDSATFVYQIGMESDGEYAPQPKLEFAIATVVEKNLED